MPKRRLVALGQRLGYKLSSSFSVAKIAQRVIEDEEHQGGAHIQRRQEFQLLAKLSTEELVSIGRKLALSFDSRSKPAMIKTLLTSSLDFAKFDQYDDHPSELDQDECDGRDEELAAWAGQYLRQAEATGEVIDFGNDVDQPSPAGATVRMVCEVWKCLECHNWLRWQQFCTPKSRDICWVADEFETPYRWWGARMFLKNPWDFAFSRFLMVADEDAVSFSLRHVTGCDLDMPTKRWLAHSVLDGLHYDYPYDVPGDPIVIASPWRNLVAIQIGYVEGFCIKENGYKEPDRRGFVWDTRNVHKRWPEPPKLPSELKLGLA